MADDSGLEVTKGDGPPESLPRGPACPWCSADLGDAPSPRCPACGAALGGDPDVEVPGVTVVDPGTVRRAARLPAPGRRNLLGLLAGDVDDRDSGIRPSSLSALAPPTAELRSEMARLRAELAEAAARGEPLVDVAPGVDARGPTDAHDAAADDAAGPDVPDAAGPAFPGTAG